MLTFEEIEKNLREENPREDIVRVITNTYINSRGELVIQKTIRQMRSLSKAPNGYLAFEGELSEVGTDAIGTSLVGVEDLLDGLYRMVVAFEGRDWETGYVEEVEYKFEPIDDKGSTEAYKGILE